MIANQAWCLVREPDCGRRSTITAPSRRRRGETLCSLQIVLMEVMVATRQLVPVDHVLFVCELDFRVMFGLPSWSALCGETIALLMITE